MSKNILNLLKNSLEKLKDFQQQTVVRIMDSFLDDSHTGRVLVADEVGLGKTVVAKGVITEMLRLRYLKHSNGTAKEPLRVTYICSNLTLANENKRKLAVFDGDDHDKYVMEPSFSRLTELAVKDKNDSATGRELLEVCSLTPSTSFTLSKGDGWHRERFTIFMLLSQHESLIQYERSLSQLFQGKCGVDTWNYNDHWFKENREIDVGVQGAFFQLLNSKSSYIEENWMIPETTSWLAILIGICNKEIKCIYPNRLRSGVRRLLARSCVKNIKSDLFILDEFQRFNSLLDTNKDNELSVIARSIFEQGSEAKLLLLSATPFKAMSQIEDEENETAHVDELRHLLNFLTKKDEDFMSYYESNREKLHCQIIGLRNPAAKIEELESTYKCNVESSLSPYICRTERAQVADKADTIIVSKKGSDQALACLAKFDSNEITAFKELDQIAVELKKLNKKSHSSFLLEYQKSSPWTLSFMNGYQFKKHIDESLKEGRSLSKVIKNSNMSWLSRNLIDRYKLDLSQHGTNARFKATLDTFFDGKGEELLWMPPSNPYYPLEGSFIGQEKFSKSLLFSSWAMVPRALSALISYEAERRLLEGRKGVVKEYFKSKDHVPKIRFDGTSSLIGWSLLYPSKVLTNLKVFNEGNSLKQIRIEVEKQLKPLVKQFSHYSSGRKSKTNWYAVAPILLDMLEGHEQDVVKWQNEMELKLNDGRNKSRYESFNHLNNIIKSKQLGPIPSDIYKYLAELAIASPAICITRSISLKDKEVNTGSISHAALGFISLFNKIESENTIKKKYAGQDYWRSIIKYCADGNLQAVIDEYCHLLFDSGLGHQEVLDRLVSVLSINTVSVGCHFHEDIKDKKKEGSKGEKSTLRCHYAVPLGSQKMTDEKGLVRVAHVRDAFNSPFRPFVLNSTSIGQEGLDFHWYCSRVIHWNLPSNPIDLEQREGRVNRYKSLVVRRRLVELFGSDIDKASHDVWGELFEYADEKTKDDRCSDLVPFWHLPEGTAQIERVVPLMPMSKDLIRLNESLKILSLYRLAFGQPRQEELIDNLLERNFTAKEIEMIKGKLVINLSPLIRNKMLKLDLIP
tara:strand:- start:340 stop:3585 length:3246 start_codon:yes stop_codon:yes gene_type:complete